MKQRKDSTFSFVKNTISNSPNIARTKFLKDDRLPYFISIDEFSIMQRRFILLAQTNLCQWALTEEHAVEIHEDERGIWPDSDKMNDIYIYIYAFLSKDSQKTWNIF